MLKGLYRDQSGQVVTDKTSKIFDITRGTKQGDPLSTLLFNALLEHIFRPLKAKWAARKHGIEMTVAQTEFLTNLRFADDVLLFGCSKKQIQKMMEELKLQSAKHGLQMHPGDKWSCPCGQEIAHRR